MIYRIINLVNTSKCYNYLNSTVPILFERNDNFHHNKKRLEHFKPSVKTFEGSMCCGGTSYLLNYYLNQYDVETKLVKSTFGYGKYLEDHCFLLYDDKIIIDPTYKQFFTSGYEGKGNDPYYNYLYSKLPFIFVGNFEDITDIQNNLRYLYYRNYKKPIDSKLFFWKVYSDYSYLLDLEKVINDKEYAKDKGKMFEDLYIYFN